MDPITKPNIDKIVENVKTLLRNGVYTVYEIVQQCATGTNKCIEWVNTNGSTLKDNEDARISAETARQQAEGSDVTTSPYYNMGRCKAERDRATEFAGWATTLSGKADKEELATTLNSSMLVANVYCKGKNPVTEIYAGKENLQSYLYVKYGGKFYKYMLSIDTVSMIAYYTLTNIYSSEAEVPTSMAKAMGIATATTTSNGLMSAADKKKLDLFESMFNDDINFRSTNGFTYSSVNSGDLNIFSVHLKLNEYFEVTSTKNCSVSIYTAEGDAYSDANAVGANSPMDFMTNDSYALYTTFVMKVTSLTGTADIKIKIKK